jgi:hypothetical protein
LDRFVSMLEGLVDAKLFGIEVGCIARVQSFSATKGTMDVVPLLRVENEFKDSKDFPVLSNIPVSHPYGGGCVIKLPYKRGDLVWVTFSANDIRKALQGSPSQKTKRRWNMQDACVVGGIKRESLVPSPNSALSLDGIVIGFEDKSSYLQIKDDEIKLKSAKIIMTDGTVSFDALTHEHISGSPGTPTVKPTNGS